MNRSYSSCNEEAQYHSGEFHHEILRGGNVGGGGLDVSDTVGQLASTNPIKH